MIQYHVRAQKEPCPCFWAKLPATSLESQRAAQNAVSLLTILRCHSTMTKDISVPIVLARCHTMALVSWCCKPTERLNTDLCLRVTFFATFQNVKSQKAKKVLNIAIPNPAIRDSPATSFRSPWATEFTAKVICCTRAQRRAPATKRPVEASFHKEHKRVGKPKDHILGQKNIIRKRWISDL